MAQVAMAVILRATLDAFCSNQPTAECTQANCVACRKSARRFLLGPMSDPWFACTNMDVEHVRSVVRQRIAADDALEWQNLGRQYVWRECSIESG